MADTLGDLIDKLTISNIRVWHLEDARRELTEHDPLKLQELTEKTNNANKERNSLIDQINASMRVLVDKKNNKDSSFSLTADDILGTGKNKFYKTEDDVEKYNPNKINEELKGWDNSEYFGQWKTDEVIESYFPNKRNGLCIECGAANGIKGSNTYYFEKQKDWNCLCIEPNPEHRSSLLKHRLYHTICACSDKKGKQVLTIYKVGDNDISSSITSLDPDQRLIEDHKDIINHSYDVEVDVKLLGEVIHDYTGKKKIDFISIDTEGTELKVLQGFDFGYYDVTLFVIENNYNDPEIEEFMKTKGYKLDQRYKINDFYVKDK